MRFASRLGSPSAVSWPLELFLRHRITIVLVFHDYSVYSKIRVFGDSSSWWIEAVSFDSGYKLPGNRK